MLFSPVGIRLGVGLTGLGLIIDEYSSALVPAMYSVHLPPGISAWIWKFDAAFLVMISNNFASHYILFPAPVRGCRWPGGAADGRCYFGDESSWASPAIPNLPRCRPASLLPSSPVGSGAAYTSRTSTKYRRHVLPCPPRLSQESCYTMLPTGSAMPGMERREEGLTPVLWSDPLRSTSMYSNRGPPQSPCP